MLKQLVPLCQHQNQRHQRDRKPLNRQQYPQLYLVLKQLVPLCQPRNQRHQQDRKQLMRQQCPQLYLVLKQLVPLCQHQNQRHHQDRKQLNRQQNQGRLTLRQNQPPKHLQQQVQNVTARLETERVRSKTMNKHDSSIHSRETSTVFGWNTIRLRELTLRPIFGTVVFQKPAETSSGRW